MNNVTQLPQREFDLPMEVLGVLKRHAEPSISEIAHDIEMQHQRRFDTSDYVQAIERLEMLGWEILEYQDVDVTRYSLVTGGNAA
ncbi:MAG: hypothetical protein VX796_05900 [Pseudomonadota bacterium]|nr:hypothetical protein [Pseudomonadota bacterium]